VAELKACRPAGQPEAWRWLELVIDRAAGKYRFDYRYDTPPLLATQVAASGRWLARKHE
jgi:hypothetical protein